jgi:hypothetical protein
MYPKKMMFGAQPAVRESHDLLIVHHVGRLTEAEAQSFVEAISALQAENRGAPSFAVVMLGADATMAPEARRVFGTMKLDDPLHETIMVNAPVAMRVIVGLVTRARSLMLGVERKLHFVPNETEARELIAHMRARHAGSSMSAAPPP